MNPDTYTISVERSVDGRHDGSPSRWTWRIYDDMHHVVIAASVSCPTAAFALAIAKYAHDLLASPIPSYSL